MSGDLISHRNLSKLVEGSLFAIIDLLLGAKFIALYLIWRVGDDFHKKSQIKKIYSFIFFTFNFFHVNTAVKLKHVSW